LVRREGERLGRERERDRDRKRNGERQRLRGREFLNLASKIQSRICRHIRYIKEGYYIKHKEN
jgi:hypothetical protein